MFARPKPGEKIAVIMDGGLDSAVTAAAMSELYGKESVVAVLCPHLSVDNPDGVFATCQRFCGEMKTVPITMAVADIMNELSNAGISVESRKLIDRFISHARYMVSDALRENGYLTAPDFVWDATYAEVEDMADTLGVPREFFSALDTPPSFNYNKGR